MLSRITAVFPITAMIVISGPAAECQVDSAAAEAFKQMIAAHREAESIDLTCTMQISLSQEGATADGDKVEAVFKRRKNGDGMMSVNGYSFYINGDTLYATHESNEEEYFELKIQDFVHSTIVWECFGSFDRVPFPHLAILWGSDVMEELYMEIYVDTPEIVPSAYIDRMVDGSAVRTLELSGPDGVMRIDLDPNTMFVRAISHTVMGGWAVQQGTTKVVTYAFEPAEGGMNVSAEDVRFDAGDRQFVDSILTLENMTDIAAQPQQPNLGGEAPGLGPMVGKDAPGFLLQTTDGELVDLDKLKDHIVVIDFWATWCPPCVKALPELHEVAAWAKKQGFPVKVFAINTFENGETLDARLKVVNNFWKNAGHTLPVLMDHDDSVAALYGVTGIPATFVIGPDGVIAAQHSGYGPGYGDNLKDEITNALEM